MLLSKIKLAGFKSFVDPTTIMLPSRRVAIVGPNGCGKSNIIDAISWVMGESSPKYLRGESLTDVIFNGSTGRKPVGQASVELVFDNQSGSIAGEFAKFAEISIKRVLSREGDAGYYLNGVKCRKRDVVDIFLGTGLGPRSYSIIGQNMINRIIEAKPDDMRANLEEAAGISKYKERRHETELRIKHTRENLDRINDLRTELEKQLSHLKHQANVAERFKNLKQQERVFRAQWFGSQWRQLDNNIIEYSLLIQKEETALQAQQTDLVRIERELDARRQDQHSLQESFQEVQKRYYQAGNEITRIEQDILHHQEKQQQCETDLSRSQSDCQELQAHLEETTSQLQQIEQEIVSINPEIDGVKAQLSNAENKLESAEEETQIWQTKWDEFNQQAAKVMQTAQVEKNRIEHLEQKMNFIQKRQTQLLQDQNKFDFEQLNKDIHQFSELSVAANQTVTDKTVELNQVRQEITAVKDEQQKSNNRLDKIRSDIQQLKGQQASLEALQQTALGQRDNPTTPWVKQQQLENNPRLAQGIEVETGWELVVEKVLGFCLQAICVDRIDQVLQASSQLKAGNLCVFAAEEANASMTSANLPRLLDKIKSKWPLDSLLHGIYVATSVEQALEICKRLEPHESIITQDGVWMNRSWLKMLRTEDAAAGVFQREQELKKLAQLIESQLQAKLELENAIAERQKQLSQLELRRDQLQQELSQKQAEAAQLVQQNKNKQEKLNDLTKQAERCQKDLKECADQLIQVQNEINKTKSLWQQALSESENYAANREKLMQDRDEARTRLLSLRDEYEERKDTLHDLELRLQTNKSQQSGLQQNLGRLQTQLSNLTERQEKLKVELASLPSIDAFKQSLSIALDKHVAIEAELNNARITVEALEQEIRLLDEQRHHNEKNITHIRTTLENLRLESHAWKVKADTISEQIKETEFSLEIVLAELDPNISVEDHQAKLEQVTQRIQRLGAINLMAIEEFATCSERKEYLDRQVADLEAGLQMLEDAIAKIDKETRARFKETFDKVNERFQELFPSIFGGGKAYLELNSDNLLEAGVTVMACPPGKRNSTIHLLSGGEKALTAIALVFSIFHLNPAPFCLLDEVDAPLDDANINRFCNLVSAMSDKTQFFFISHNKVTIEMAEHLIGVTMNEPGVSRLVSVDVEKAMNLVNEE